MEFHLSDDSPLSLVEMRFHVPHSNVLGPEEDQESSGPDPVKELHQKILAKADVIQATGDAIVTFSEIHCLTPRYALLYLSTCVIVPFVLYRGRYSIKVYPSFLQLHGKTYDYKIPHKSVMRLFLLPHNDQRQMLFVIQLDPPLRQGQTRYYFVMLSLPAEQDCEVALALTK
jgi:structure-specific recognition protein 1